MNSDVIKLLPDSVANQIAAGEVIQRPASVIKELVENSIDAGATSIQIILKDAGRTLIQVIDNGIGMSPTDARMAFERHATSKIDTVDDLYSLHTMGFRGEALPSIAAVAQIDLRSMRAGETVGSRLRISESRFEGQEPCSCVPGTNLMVKNLFFHMPARRKFLKKDSIELSHILHEFERLALVNTSVEFTIIHNDVVLHQLPAGTLKQRIMSLFGKAIGGQIIPVGTETTLVKISGFVGLPHHARRRGVPQYFFVNGRNMRHPYFHKAVLSCYSELIAADVQPAYFINFEVDPSTIDVNIHPQKHEIKFENEQPIWQILTAAVKQALGKVNAAGAIDFDSDEIPEIPIFQPDPSAEMPSIAIDDNYNPFDTASTAAKMPQKPAHQQSESANRPIGNFSRANQAPHDWERLYQSFATRRDAPSQQPEEVTPPATAPSIASDQPSLLPDEAQSVNYLTINNKYVVVPSREGMMVINRRRAHIRVLFDHFLMELQRSSFASQKLIFPESINLSPAQSAILSSIGDLIERLGFDISFLGDNTWAINAVPSLPTATNPIEALTRMVADIEDTGEMPETALIEPAALCLARSAAINPGQALSADETDALIAGLFSSAHPSYTPDGLKTYTIISNAELTKMFS